MAHLDEIIAFNQKVTGTLDRPSGLSQHARRELCIVTCVDPRLVRFFPSALGVERGDAVLIRLPGAVVRPGTGDGLRAVAAAVYINRATEFLVMGHTQCGTTTIDVAAVTSEMDKRKVPAGAMPGGVREFLGAVSDLRQAVRQSAQAIRGAAFIPRDVLVHAAILDIETGALEIVERGENFQSDLPSALASSDSLLSSIGGSVGGSVQSILDAAQRDMGFLASTPSSALFDGPSALTASADPFAGLASSLPPGWSDGALAMAPSSVSAAPSALATPLPPFPEAPAARATLTSLEPATPMRHAPPARSAVPPPQQPPPQRRAARAPPPERAHARARPAPADPEADENMNKVRDFYKVNFTLEQRRKVARALAQAARGHASSGELVKIVVKPILDLGQKRYKVIDEVIAIKEQATRMDPDDALALLSQIFQ